MSFRPVEIVLATCALLGCAEATSTTPESREEAQAEAPAPSQPDPEPVPSPQPERVGIPDSLNDPPAGFRFRGTELHAAAFFVAQVLEVDLMVVAASSEITSDLEARSALETLRALATLVELEATSARRGGPIWLASSAVIERARGVSIRQLHGGEPIALDFLRADVTNVIQLLGAVERLEIESGLSGSLSLRFREGQGRSILADLARLGGATAERRAQRVEIGGGVFEGTMRAGATECGPVDRAITAHCTPVADLRLVGTAGGEDALALLTTDSAAHVVRRGDHVGQSVLVEGLQAHDYWRVARIAAEGVVLELQGPGPESVERRFIPLTEPRRR